MSLSPGTRLGPYEILSLLGAGGMGEVYRARDTRLDRAVAVKVLSPDVASSPEGRQRFEREARTVSQLSHPHICALYDVGHEGDTEFLVMELLEGETLVDRLAKGALPIEQTLRYGVEIAAALDVAHRQGIVHRDLKPGNVMLTRSGVKLLDFGLAKAVQPLAVAARSVVETAPAQQALTEAGMFVGTLQYMAPEQVTGGPADARSDIFAFGAVLYEMATGARAFSGSSRVALATAILNEQPAPISSLRPTISPLFDRLIQVCLAKDPDDRWQHARDVALQLTSLQIASSGSSAVAVPPPARIKRVSAIWGGTWGRDGQILFAEIGGDAIYRTSTAGEAPVVAVKATQAKSAIGPRWPSYLPDGRHFFYLEKAPGAGGSLMLAEVGHTPRRVMAVDSNAAYIDPGYVVFAREGILLGQQLDVGNGRAVGEPFSIANPVKYFAPTGAAEFAISRGGALAYKQRGAVTRVARLDRDGKELGILGASAQNARLHLSRDGRTVVFDRQQSGMGTMDVWSIDLARGIEARLTADPGTEVGPVLISGTRDVIFGSTKRGGPPNLVRKNLETGVEEFLLPPARALQFAEDVSPDGKVLLFSQRAEAGEFQFWTLRLFGKEAPLPFLTSGADDAGARIAPDGGSVAYLSSDSGRHEVHLTSFPARGASTRVSSGGARLPRWSSDGRQLFYIATDGQLMTVPVHTSGALQVGRPLPVPGFSGAQRWAFFEVLPDGQFVAIISEASGGEQPLTVVLNRPFGPAQP